MKDMYFNVYPKGIGTGIDIRQIQEHLGHAKVETTMIYTHVIKDLRNPVASPLDALMS